MDDALITASENDDLTNPEEAVLVLDADGNEVGEIYFGAQFEGRLN